MYTKDFEIRWNDIDANRHLANSAYMNFMSHTRMSFLIENGLSQQQLSNYNIGPVVFYEHIYYFKELLPEDRVRVSLQLKGMSKNGVYFEFVHKLYNQDGKHCAQCEIMGGWIDLNARKLTPLPDNLLTHFEKLERAEDFAWLSKEDTRKFGKHPKDL